MSIRVVVRKCEALEEFHACVELQRVVWGESDLEVERVTSFVVASETDRQVLGEFEGAGSSATRSPLSAFVKPFTAFSLPAFTRNIAIAASAAAGYFSAKSLGRGFIQWTFDPLEFATHTSI
jgi:predicted GNAT superfamily acetyltransferase